MTYIIATSTNPRTWTLTIATLNSYCAQQVGGSYATRRAADEAAAALALTGVDVLVLVRDVACGPDIYRFLDAFRPPTVEMLTWQRAIEDSGKLGVVVPTHRSASHMWTPAELTRWLADVSGESLAHEAREAACRGDITTLARCIVDLPLEADPLPELEARASQRSAQL